MADKNNLLIEIGTEELPPKSLKKLAEAFAGNIKQKLVSAEFTFSEIKFFATPRRLAVMVYQLNSKQPDRSVERRGPALRAAFDDNGKPTKALEGFAHSCNTTVNKLEKLETTQGSWIVYRYQEQGKTIDELLSSFVNQALNELPIPKPMRWDNGDVQFVRPVHWVVMLYGKKLIKDEVLGVVADKKTYGHRFHHPAAIVLPDADSYQKLLKEKGRVIVDFAERKKMILEQVENIAKQKNSQAIIPEALLDEVTGLVEWPAALLANFGKEFLAVPREALISAMQDHQRCFALKRNQDELLPCFITISNIESKDPQEVVRGNERVMRARLADAKFFYETDCKQKLSDRLENLKQVVFQAKLGSLCDKSQRVAELAKLIAEKCGVNSEHAYRAGLLCKTDLLTNMVGEFPELQGIMGYYYAKQDSEDIEVAKAIRDHYRPRFAWDELPETLTGCAVALADRLDTLVNIFKIGLIPTGDKDPFGLRRAALGIVRVVIEKELNLDLAELLIAPQPEVISQVCVFILERLPAWYGEQGITGDTLQAVLTVQQDSRNLIDMHHRVLAVKNFRQLPQAQSLAAANKRVKNLLSKSAKSFVQTSTIDQALFSMSEERDLFAALRAARENAQPLIKSKSYTALLIELANLQMPVDKFFDKVLVMDENEKLRNNRLALLAELRQLFLTVADISLLQD
jgi:glycyl-tRNA synthetase beta chain